jgi:hypothetical protein
MEADLPRLRGNIELCGLPLDFRPVGLGSGFWLCPWGSGWTRLAIRMWPTHLPVTRFSPWLYSTLRVALLLMMWRGRVLGGNDRCGRGFTAGTCESFEEIPEFSKNRYCQCLLAVMLFYSTLFLVVFQARSCSGIILFGRVEEGSICHSQSFLLTWFGSNCFQLPTPQIISNISDHEALYAHCTANEVARY